jgi:hypothetical protein
LLFACICLVAAPLIVHAETKAKPATAEKAKAAQPAMDAKAMEEMMAKAATPGPQHEKLKGLVGEWNVTVKTTMDPSQPATESKGTSVVTALMDGRYFQEQSSGDMGGMPFSGMGITGYDNVLQKYVSSWIDNMGTGIMTSEGTASAAGDVINWTGWASEPMSGKKAKYRMVTRFVDDNKHVFEMYGTMAGGKESKMMEITYERKM